MYGRRTKLKRIKQDIWRIFDNILKKRHRKLIKDTKANYFYNKILSKNPSKTSRYIIKHSNRPAKKYQSSNIFSLCINANFITEPSEVSNSFNEFFVKVHKTVDENIASNEFSGFPFHQIFYLILDWKISQQWLLMTHEKSYWNYAVKEFYGNGQNIVHRK